MKRTRLIALLLLLVMCFSLTACGDKQTPSTSGSSSQVSSSTDGDVDFPTKTITLVIPWAAGSSGDNGARILMPFVEKELGTSIAVVNNPGASGWLGWDEVAAADPDGYTISLLTLPSFYGGYMNPANNRTTNLDDFQMIANQKHQPWRIGVNKPTEDSLNTNQELQTVLNVTDIAKRRREKGLSNYRDGARTFET